MALRKYLKKLRNNAKEKLAQVEARLTRAANSSPGRSIKLITTAPFLKYHQSPDPSAPVLAVRNPDYESTSAGSSTITILTSDSSSYFSADDTLSPSSATNSSWETAISAFSEDSGAAVVDGEIRPFLRSPLTRLTRALRSGAFPAELASPRFRATESLVSPAVDIHRPDSHQGEGEPTSSAPLNPREGFHASLVHPSLPRKRFAGPTWRTSFPKRRAVLTYRTKMSALRSSITTLVVHPSVKNSTSAPFLLDFSDPNAISPQRRALPNYLFRNPNPAPAPASGIFPPETAQFTFTFPPPASAPRPAVPAEPADQGHDVDLEVKLALQRSAEEDFRNFFRDLCEAKFKEIEWLSRRLEQVVVELRDLL